MDGYQELANAVILQAVKDYRGLWTQLELNRNDRKVKRRIRKIEDFFHSEWFNTLSKLDGAQLIKDIQDDLERNGAV